MDKKGLNHPKMAWWRPSKSLLVECMNIRIRQELKSAFAINRDQDPELKVDFISIDEAESLHKAISFDTQNSK